MEKPVLKYTASRIAHAEMQFNKNFFTALGDISMSSLLFLFIAGGGTEEEFDEYFKKGVGPLMELVLDGVEAGGFFDKKALEEAKKAIAELKAKASQTSGEADKK